MIMVHPRRDPGGVLLAMLLVLAAVLVPPAACHAIKWQPFTANVAEMLVSASPNSLSMFHSGPKPGTSTTIFLGNTVTIGGTLVVQNSTSGRTVRSIQLSGSVFKAGTRPPATASLSTPDYKNQLASTTLTAKARAMPAEGCVQEFPLDGSEVPVVCVPVLVDVDWVAQGTRLAAFDLDSRTNRVNYTTNPPTRNGQISKNMGADYRATNTLRVRVVNAATQGVLFKGQIACTVAGACAFTVSQQPNRVLASS